MIFCGPTLSVFPDKRCWENISLTSIAQKQSLSLSWMVLNTMRIETSKKDADRTAFLEGYGLRVIRIPNNDVGRNFCGVCEYIDAAVKQSLSQLR
ncbi:MAG: DUF559 domain-containing protein [Subdoligranulum sp.]